MADREKREGGGQAGTRKRQRETPADRQRIGTTIAGSYRIDEFLGRGAIGAVFGGMHLRLERRVAIKFVDPTPENVFLVDRDGESEFVKVVDFGLSTFIQSDDTRLTRAGQSVGTPLYMAPEQAGASAFDARVDVYSLGVLIFEMTTGRLPF